ncbi:hypothetical protein HDU96_003699 [Phlyctochytrium bullatum]|nr:hypothetical protein HDU96_003699 [Phlyctochytrium bullatum]
MSESSDGSDQEDFIPDDVFGAPQRSTYIPPIHPDLVGDFALFLGLPEADVSQENQAPAVENSGPAVEDLGPPAAENQGPAVENTEHDALLAMSLQLENEIPMHGAVENEGIALSHESN